LVSLWYERMLISEKLTFR